MVPVDPDEVLLDALRPLQRATHGDCPTPRSRQVATGLLTATAMGFGAALANPSLPSRIGTAYLATLLVALFTGVVLWSWIPPKRDGLQFAPSTTRSTSTVLLSIPFFTLYTLLWWPSYGVDLALLGLAGALVTLGVYGQHPQARRWGAGALLLLFAALWFGSPDDLQSPLRGGVALVEPLSMALRGKSADPWFFYSTLYTVGVAAMAIRMVSRHRHERYHLIRTASVVFWQASFGFAVPALLAKAGQKEHYFTYFWPLKPEYLLPFELAGTWDAGTVARAMILWSIFAALVGAPVLTYLYGKRWYCSWVCGCGALAETVGDPWRHLSDTSERAWRFERVSIHAVLVVIAVVTSGLWVHEALGRPWLSDGGSALFWRTYGFFVVAGFAGILGTGFYPVLGPRIWCRFGCPQAALLGLIQRFYSRFRITTNGGQCISCGNCSTFCEMGIDVRAYAQRGSSIVRASCVGCGICASVCPRGVLKLENGPPDNRFDGADDPIGELLRSLGLRDRDRTK